jgi:hypothetical protein
LIMGYVVFNTCKKSKLRYLYLTSTMYLLSAFFTVASGVLV